MSSLEEGSPMPTWARGWSRASEEGLPGTVVLVPVAMAATRVTQALCLGGGCWKGEARMAHATAAVSRITTEVKAVEKLVRGWDSWIP
jgi:hypothetical protein